MSNPNTIELEHIALVFATEFIKLNKDKLDKDSQGRLKFLRMNATQRLKLIEDTLDKISKDYR